jgi:hypothetical protein
MMIPILATLWILLSLLIAILGRQFRFRFWGYFFASMLLTPAIGLLLLCAAVPIRDKSTQ